MNVSDQDSKEPIVMAKPDVTPDLQISNYDELYHESEVIKKDYSHTIGDRKALRATMRQLSRLYRSLNALRKDKTRPHRNIQKQFKSKIDALIDNIKAPYKVIKKQVAFYDANDAKQLAKELEPDMKQICASRGIKELPVPPECLKKSYSHKKRLDIMVGVADTYVERQNLRHAHDINGKAMIPDKNGAMHEIGVARKMTFFGDKYQLQGLLKYIKKHNLIINLKK